MSGKASRDRNQAVGPVGAYRRYWLPELVVLVLAALAGTVLFAVTRIDVTTAGWFYRPGLANPWPVAKESFWTLLYRSPPWLTGTLGLVGAGMLTVGLLRRGARRLRLHGLFILLSVALGPGVIINGVLKDHWGRPRPRQLVEFGGSLPYVAPLMPSAERGKSFPCGHCSVGFLFALGWWLWRRRRPRRAAASLATGLVLGTLLGVERLAAGGHFLSDDLWSALIAFGVAHALYYYVLRIPAREDARGPVYPLIERSPGARRAAVAGTILLTLGILVGGILSTPQSANLDTRIRLATYPGRPQTLEVVAPTLDVDLKLVDRPAGEIRCSGYLRGFGLPTDRIQVTWHFRPVPVRTLTYRIALQGWFTDMDGVAHLTIPCEDLRRIVVRVGHGDITVHDKRPRGASRGSPVLDLRTGFGSVQRK